NSGMFLFRASSYLQELKDLSPDIYQACENAVGSINPDLDFIRLVTPTSQIVGTQAVLNVLTGERYKTIAKETAGILKGEYGHTP
ncbi:hypothetical protein ONQ60_26940, partial [Salmonella enterica subsp. enterica serovar Virginia]|nr:hypothetical protein [Salmonella enterica subsp. enterica serovar Virginia]